MGVGAGAGTLALIALILIPAGDAGHCSYGIAVYGRSALAPGIVPPPSPVSGYCVPIESTLPTGHMLAPGSDQIYVRVEVDVGTAYPRLQLRLDGLGFHDHEYWLARGQDLTGRWTYDVDEWLSIPAAPNASGELRATVIFPGGHAATARYELMDVPSPLPELGLP